MLCQEWAEETSALSLFYSGYVDNAIYKSLTCGYTCCKFKFKIAVVALSKTTETYIDFFKINQESYGDKIRFYERYRSVIAFLPEAENLELRLYYLIALFEVGEYEKYLFLIDRTIEHIVAENIYEFNGRDIYYQLLLNKAACLYNVFRNNEAEKLSQQLRRMDRSNEINNLLLEKIYARMLSGKTRHVKALGIAIYFLSGFVIAVQLFLVEPFYNQYSDAAQNTWQSLFLFASIILVINELTIKYRSKHRLKTLGKDN